jgi:malonyl-CoA/methylmalonyl-CoA synthetase
VQRGIWRAGGVAVPLAVSHPPAELEYVIRDSGASVVVAGPGFEDVARAAREGREGALRARGRRLNARRPPTAAPAVVAPRAHHLHQRHDGKAEGRGEHARERRLAGGGAGAGVGWRPSDRLLLVLPLHHVHGIINGLGSALAVRATCEILPAFDADKVWERLSSGEITVFTAVPTIYSSSSPRGTPRRARRRPLGRRARPASDDVGLAALPVHVLERWREISGHTLLERYGMTEIGMALSNPLDGERRPGCVGSRCPAWTCTWSTKTASRCRRDARRARGARPGRVPRVLAAAGRNRGGVSQRLVPHRRHGGARGRRRTGCSGAPASTSSRPAASSVGARNRGSAAHASGRGRVRGRRRERPGVG